MHQLLAVLSLLQSHYLWGAGKLGESGLMLIDLAEQLATMLEIHGNCPVFMDSEIRFDRVLDVEYNASPGKECVAIKSYIS